MRLSKGAVKFTAGYIVLFVLLAGLAYFTSDAKGAFFLAQLSVLPGAAFVNWTGLVHFVHVDSWLNSVFATFPLSLIIVYLVGWGLSVIINHKDPSAPIAEDPPDWHKR